MARHARHAPHVDTDQRQDSAEAVAARQSLVERTAVRLGARAQDLANDLRRSHLRDRIRFHRSPIAYRMQRRSANRAVFTPSISRGFLSRGYDGASWFGDRQIG